MSHFDVVSSQPLAIMSSKFEQMDQYSPHSCDREALKGQKGQSGLFQTRLQAPPTNMLKLEGHSLSFLKLECKLRLDDVTKSK